MWKSGFLKAMQIWLKEGKNLGGGETDKHRPFEQSDGGSNFCFLMNILPFFPCNKPIYL